MKRALLLFPAVVLLCLSSCTLFEKNIAVLWTEIPEIAAYVEVFNTVQEEYKIELQYKSRVAEALIDETEHPDIAIGKGFTSTRVIPLFSDLGSLFEENMVERSRFYTSLLKLGKREEEQLVLPVSFNLPVIIFKSERLSQELQDFTLDMEHIETLSIEFNGESKPRRWIMGFSPRWSADFMHVYAMINGTGFSENLAGQLVWNNQKLENSILQIRDWSSRVNENVEDEERFMEKYFYDPAHKLLRTERILFSYTTLVDFMAIKKENRGDLDFRYLGYEDRIPVLENIVYTGIPKKARNNKAASAFMTWFFQPETQLLCMETARFKRMRVFGVTDGLSSFPQVNEKSFPQYYPELSGHIPSQELLRFPEPLPLEWDMIRDEVLKPYLAQEAGHTGSIESFDSLLQKWLIQHTD